MSQHLCVLNYYYQVFQAAMFVQHASIIIILHSNVINIDIYKVLRNQNMPLCNMKVQLVDIHFFLRIFWDRFWLILKNVLFGQKRAAQSACVHNWVTAFPNQWLWTGTWHPVSMQTEKALIYLTLRLFCLNFPDIGKWILYIYSQICIKTDKNTQKKKSTQFCWWYFTACEYAKLRLLKLHKEFDYTFSAFKSLDKLLFDARKWTIKTINF